MEDYGKGWIRQNIRPAGRIGVTNDSQGGLNVLVRDKSGLLWEKRETLGCWTQWMHLEEFGQKKSDVAYGVILANHRRDGRMAVFTRDMRGEILFSFIDAGNVRSVCWQELNAASSGCVAVCERCTGGMEAFHIDPDNQLWHIWTNPQGQWSQWDPLGGPVCFEVSVANNQEGFPQVFGRFSNGSVGVRRHHANGVWGEWFILKEKDVLKSASIQETDGRIRLTVCDSKGRIQTCRQSDEPDLWENWEMLPSGECTDIQQVENEKGQTMIMGIKYDGSLISIVHDAKHWQRTDDREINIGEMKTGRLSDKRPCFLVTGQDGYLYIREGV